MRRPPVGLLLPLLLPLALACGRRGRDRDADDDAATPPRVVEIRASQAGEEGPATTVTTARYEPRHLDPVIEELRERDRTWRDELDEETAAIRKRSKERDERERKEKLVLRSTLPADAVPASPGAFQQVAHRAPVAQYYTGTCWSFATTSFLESEVERITGRKVDLSEMAPVYWEYQAKAERFLRQRGDSLFAEGSQAGAVLRMWNRHGAWPHQAYPGFAGEDPRHDHQRLFREMEALLGSLEARDMWDVDSGLAMLRVLLDRHLGRPPQTFTYQGASYTPRTFMQRVLQIEPDDYVEFMSTLKIPFYSRGEFEVPDNWWHGRDYHNLPLDDFYAALRASVRAGYSAVIAVDVSEPGKAAAQDAMFVPAYDIPPARIDQLAREYRLAHGVTTDDHGVHLVGHTRHDDHDWFLVKDSGRSARRGRYPGYYFVRGDYVRLKVLAFTVHRDAVADLLARFP